jgi:metal-responsive CopG/Arc/MetJ family transcriptional regulator
MTTIKTAISIERSLFNQVNDLAEKLQMPRSQLFALAVEAFIEQHENRKMLQALNEVYAGEPDPTEERLHKEMRQQHRQLVEGQW